MKLDALGQTGFELEIVVPYLSPHFEDGLWANVNRNRVSSTDDMFLDQNHDEYVLWRVIVALARWVQEAFQLKGTKLRALAKMTDQSSCVYEFLHHHSGEPAGHACQRGLERARFCMWKRTKKLILLPLSVQMRSPLDPEPEPSSMFHWTIQG